jgi:hypothetical protein
MIEDHQIPVFSELLFVTGSEERELLNHAESETAAIA